MIDVGDLRWDEWNVAHIARHGVTPGEMIEVCHGEPVVQEGKKDRSLIFGPTRSGRMLTVVLDAEGEGLYYPVTARPASRRERAIYTREKGGDAQ